MHHYMRRIVETSSGTTTLNDMDNQKTRLLGHESIPCINMNADIVNYINKCSTCPDFQQGQLKEKIIHYPILDKPWEIIGAEMFSFYIKNHLCIFNYHSRFPVTKRQKSADNLKLAWKIICLWYGLPMKIM